MSMRTVSRLVRLLVVSLLVPLSVSSPLATTRGPRWEAVPKDWRFALAGGLAGGLTNGVLHPLDTAKTLRQRVLLPNGSRKYANTAAAFVRILKERGPAGLYGGLAPAVVGAIPSSALYFGTYEAVKRRLKQEASNLGARNAGSCPDLERHIQTPIYMASAVCGNAASSLVFVPKEFVKQQLQVR